MVVKNLVKICSRSGLFGQSELLRMHLDFMHCLMANEEPHFIGQQPLFRLISVGCHWNVKMKWGQPVQCIMSGAWGWKHFNLAGDGVYIERNVLFTVCDLGRVTGNADWQLLLENNRPQCSSWETGFCLPLPFRGIFQDHWEIWTLEGNLKQAYELFSPEKEQYLGERTSVGFSVNLVLNQRAVLKFQWKLFPYCSHSTEKNSSTLPELYIHHYQHDFLCSLTKNPQSGAGISAQHDKFLLPQGSSCLC